MAKKNVKRGKLETWLPICSMGGTIIGSVVSIATENILYLLVGLTIGLMLGVLLGIDDIKFDSKKENKVKKESKGKSTTKSKKETKKTVKTKKK